MVIFSILSQNVIAASLIVDNNGDGLGDCPNGGGGGICTLRQAIETAKSNAEADNITFSSNYVISPATSYFMNGADTSSLSIDGDVSGNKVMITPAPGVLSSLFSVFNQSDVTIENLNISSSGIPVGISVTGGSNVAIKNNVITGASSSGVEITDGAGTVGDGFIVTGNIINSSALAGVSVQSSFAPLDNIYIGQEGLDGSINGNTIVAGNGDGISVNIATTGGGVNNLVIKGNYIGIDHGGVIGGNDGHGIIVNGSPTGTYQIGGQSSQVGQNITHEGNYILNNGSSGIEVDAPVSGTTLNISDNFIGTGNFLVSDGNGGFTETIINSPNATGIEIADYGDPAIYDGGYGSIVIGGGANLQDRSYENFIAGHYLNNGGLSSGVSLDTSADVTIKNNSFGVEPVDGGGEGTISSRNTRNIGVANVGNLVIDGNILANAADFGTYITGVNVGSSIIFQNNWVGFSFSGNDAHNGANDFRIDIPNGSPAVGSIDILRNVFGYSSMGSVLISATQSNNTLVKIQGNYFGTSENGTAFRPGTGNGGVEICQGKVLFGGVNSLNEGTLGQGNVVNAKGGAGLYFNGHVHSDDPDVEGAQNCGHGANGPSEAFVYGNIFGLLNAGAGNYTSLAVGVGGEGVSVGDDDINLTHLQIGAATVVGAGVPDPNMKAGWVITNPSQLRNVFASDNSSLDNTGIWLDNLPQDAYVAIENNYIGLDYTGLSAHGYSNQGIGIMNPTHSVSIGGENADFRNVIAANLYGGIVIGGGGAGDVVEIVGNYIGVNKDGNGGNNVYEFGNGYVNDPVELDSVDAVCAGNDPCTNIGQPGINVNTGEGVVVNIGVHSESDNPSVDGQVFGNVISGNAGAGIYISAPTIFSETTPIVNIYGNTIGLNAAETTAVPNGSMVLQEAFFRGAGIVVFHPKMWLDIDDPDPNMVGKGTYVTIGYDLSGNGGEDMTASNVIAGNYGAGIASYGSHGMFIYNNYIGMNRAGVAFGNKASSQRAFFTGPSETNGAGIALIDFGVNTPNMGAVGTEVNNTNIQSNKIGGNEGSGIAIYHRSETEDVSLTDDPVLTAAACDLDAPVHSELCAHSLPGYGLTWFDLAYHVADNYIGMNKLANNLSPMLNGTLNNNKYGVYVGTLVDGFITGFAVYFTGNIINGGVYINGVDYSSDNKLDDLYAANWWTTKGVFSAILPQAGMTSDAFIGYITGSYKHIIDFYNGNMSELHRPTGTTCSDGIDNDNDGVIDLYDDDCTAVTDNTEVAPDGDVTCTEFTYSDWSECTDGVEARTVLTSTPEGCVGGTPAELSRSCGGGGGVVIIDPPNPPDPEVTCPTGYAKHGKTCVKTEIVCATGTRQEGDRCVPTPCPPNQRLMGDSCVSVSRCAPGYSWTGDRCVKIVPACTGSECVVPPASTVTNYISSVTVLSDECKVDGDCKNDQICRKSTEGSMQCVDKPTCDSIDGLSSCLKTKANEKESADFTVFGLTGAEPVVPAIVNLDGKTVDQKPLILVTYKADREVGVKLEDAETGKVLEINTVESADGSTGKLDNVDVTIMRDKNSKEKGKDIEIGRTSIDKEYKGQIAVSQPIPFGKYYATPIGSDGVKGKKVSFTVSETGIQIKDLEVVRTNSKNFTYSPSELVKTVLGTIEKSDTSGRFVANEYIDFRRGLALDKMNNKYRILVKVDSKEKDRKIAYFTYKSVIFASVALTDANDAGEYVDVPVPEYVTKNEKHTLSAYIYDPATKKQSSQKRLRFEMK